MSGHTPAPWRIDDRPNLEIWGGPNNNRFICRLKKSAVANARLIAAAPALLAACEAALSRTSMSDLLREEIEAAIAQAKGEKP